MQHVSSNRRHPHPQSNRRVFLGSAGAGVLSALSLLATSGTASALDAPSGKVVLTVTGRLTVTNDAGAASFDMNQLEALPASTIVTATPWYAHPRKYTGVLLRDLLAAVGAPTASIHAGALNDYRADIPNEDASKNGAMLAYMLDDKPMTVREKGPLVVIFPFDDRAELRDAVHYSRAIWQLRTLELR